MLEIERDEGIHALLGMSTSGWQSLSIKVSWSNLLETLSSLIGSVGRRQGPGGGDCVVTVS